MSDAADGGVVAIGGSASERERDVVRDAVANAARSAGWSLSPQPLTKQDADGIIACAVPGEPWKCVPASIGARGVRHALVVAVEPQQADGAPGFVLTGKVITTSPAALVVHQRSCEHCADDKLTQTSIELTTQLLDELASRSGRTLLEVNSVPAGAFVAVDGQAMGATNGVFTTLPGLHVVTLQKPGFHPETIKIRTEGSKPANISVTLHASEPPKRPSRVVPTGLVGAGVVLIGTGMLVYGNQHDSADYKYSHPRAHVEGVLLGLVGLGALGTGAYLWWRGSMAPTTKVNVPTISVASGGASMGWMTTF